MQVSKRFVLCCFALVLLVVLVHRPGQAQEAEFAFRVEVVAGVPTRKVGDITPWVVDVTLPVPEFVDVEVEVVLVSRLATCVAEPATCAGSENFVTTDERGFPLVFGCSDSVDNDDNELIDLEDPNCGGVSSWSLSVAIDDDFGLNGVTTEGTVADLIISPPGIRNFQSGERTYLVDPSQNDGQQGVTAYAILSLSHHHTLAPVSESVVLKVTGRLPTTGLNAPGDRGTPVSVEIVDPSLPGLAETAEGGGRRTMVWLEGLDSVEPRRRPAVFNATVQLRAAPGSPSFLRGDANANGGKEITDGIFIVNHLFLGRGEPTCRDAADTNDDGDLDTSDAISLFEFLFLGGTVPPSPGPVLCGLDGTDDALTCESFAACP